MITKIKHTVIALIAVITFVIVADAMVWDTRNWECTCTHEECEWCFDIDGEWHQYEYEAYCEYSDQFTALFNSYDYRVSKNGRSMINGKFVRMS